MWKRKRQNRSCGCLYLSSKPTLGRSGHSILTKQRYIHLFKVISLFHSGLSAGTDALTSHWVLSTPLSQRIWYSPDTHTALRLSSGTGLLLSDTGGWSQRGGLVFCSVNIDAEDWCKSRAVWKRGMTEENTHWGLQLLRQCYVQLSHNTTVLSCLTSRGGVDRTRCCVKNSTI